MPIYKEKACVPDPICHNCIMKHSESGNRKVLKQLKKSPDIKDMHTTAHGYMIRAKNGEQLLIHLSAKAFHPLRRWLKKNTNLKNLRF
jgi:hypothetical protein